MLKFQKVLFPLCFLTFLLVATANFVQAQNRSAKQLIRTAENISGDKFAFVSKTPKGARIFAVRKPNAKMLAAIDQGLTNLFAVARKNNYRAQLSCADYTVFIARADRSQNSSNSYSPDIAIGAAQYAGSVYDQGGYIYAAGMVINFDPCAFMIAEHKKNLERVAEVVRFEGEHLVLYHNDPKLYRETADHSRGGGHPILH